MKLDLPGPYDPEIPDKLGALIPRSPVALGAITTVASLMAWRLRHRKQRRLTFVASSVVALFAGWRLWQEMQDDADLEEAAAMAGYGDVYGVVPLAAGAIAAIVARSKSVRRLRAKAARLQQKIARTRNARRRQRLQKRLARVNSRLQRIIARLQARAERRQARGRAPSRRQARVLNIPRVKPMPSRPSPLPMAEGDDGAFEMVDDGAEGEDIDLDDIEAEAVTLPVDSGGGVLSNPIVLLAGAAAVAAVGYAVLRGRKTTGARADRKAAKRSGDTRAAA